MYLIAIQKINIQLKNTNKIDKERIKLKNYS